MAEKKREKQQLGYTVQSQALTYECPVRGKVTQIVQVKKYDSPILPDVLDTLPELEALTQLFSTDEDDDY